MRTATWILTFAGMAAAALTASAGPLFGKFTTFDGPGDNGGGTTVNAISNAGTIVGFSSNVNMTVLTNFVRNPNGTFTTLNIFNDPVAMANGINSAAAVVGTSIGQAFVFNNGLFSMLPLVTPNTTAETAFGINDKGAVVGQFTDAATGTTPGFVDINGTFTILSPVANAVVTNAQSINSQGLVTGFYSTDGVHQHGFFYNTATQTFTLPADPVQPNLLLTQFLGINDNGLAVGYWQDVIGSQHGFEYNLNTKQYTFMDDPNAAAINGVEITQITGINDANTITGFFVDANGVQRGFFAGSAAPVPEPAATAMIGLGLVVLGVLRRGRHGRPAFRQDGLSSSPASRK